MQQIGLRDPQKAVRRAVGLGVFSRDDASRVDDGGERASWEARRIQGGDEGAVRELARSCERRSSRRVRSRNGPAWVDAAGRLEERGGPWRIERRDGAIGCPQEAVSDEVRVVIKSRNSPRRVDPGGLGAVDALGDIEFGDGTVGTTHEAVI